MKSQMIAPNPGLKKYELSLFVYMLHTRMTIDLNQLNLENAHFLFLYT